MQFLGCLFVGLLLGVILLFALVGTLVDRILVFLGLRKPRRTFRSYGPYGPYTDPQQRNASDDAPQWQQPNTATSQRTTHPQGKIFEKDESEYVDFEEIKD